MGPAAAPGLILVTGGMRSGKSRFAERLAAVAGGQVLYLATASASDEEMAARIAAHRARRPPGWQTLEARLEVAAAAARYRGRYDVVLLEDLGLLTSNVMLQVAAERGAEVASWADCRARLEGELEALLRASERARWVVVTNEVGFGLVPSTPLGRQFVDLLGWANQRLGRAAQRVYLVVAGFAVDVSAIGQPVE